MKYLLDSNVVLALVLDTSERLNQRLAECDEDDFAVSAIAYAEVVWGSYHDRPPLFEVLDRFAKAVPVLEFDRAAALAYAALSFERASYDHLIAAHAISLDLTLITDNTRHFTKFSKLRVENWMR